MDELVSVSDISLSAFEKGKYEDATILSLLNKALKASGHILLEEEGDDIAPTQVFYDLYYSQELIGLDAASEIDVSELLVVSPYSFTLAVAIKLEQVVGIVKAMDIPIEVVNEMLDAHDNKIGYCKNNQ